jgi:hypothetical protein
MTHRLVSVIIPTYRRPFAFARAARSVFAQRAHGRALELVAVDNDPAGSALPVFKALEREATTPFFWTHEPHAGVANARNAGLALARGSLIAFLDDDEEATPHWLAHLLNTQKVTQADAVFGPVDAVLPIGLEHERVFLERFFSRRGPLESGPIVNYYGMGNSLLVRSRLLAATAPFDASANAQGGEDDILFSAAKDNGARFAWSADAVVREHVPGDRATLRYALWRAFGYGQGPSQIAARRTPRDLGGLARHMAIGALQAGLAAWPATAALAFGLPGRARLAYWMALGAGKVFWFVGQRYYGAPKPRVEERARRRPRRAQARVPLG